MAVYLIECQIHGEQYTGSTKTRLRSKASDYKNMQPAFMNKEAVPKQALKRKRFHKHCCTDRHNGLEDSVITWIDSVGILKELRRKEFTGCINQKIMPHMVLTKRVSVKRFKDKKQIACL